MKPPNQLVQRGFTLTELLVAMAIAAVLVGIALPSFRLYMQNSNATAQANQLLADLSAARVEAVRTAGAVRVTANGGSWTNGWTIATDRDRSTTVNGADVVIRQTDKAVAGFSWAAAAEGGPAVTSVFFDANGYLVGTALPIMFQLRTPDGIATNCRRVAVALSGRSEVRNGNLNPCS